MERPTPYDFIFAGAGSVNRSQLMQGDLLQRTPALAEAIAQAHAYYATASDYSHFLVLSQSCDLVRRSGACKSRYITICAVRPLSVAVQRELAKFTSQVEGFPIPIGDVERVALAKQYLARIMNNTVDGIFFIPRNSAETVEEHLCAFVPLSIALRVTHYDTCLGAKVAQCDEIFAAKIGSIASGLYSRIATPDLEERSPPDVVKSYRDTFFEEMGFTSVAWLSERQKKELKRRVKEAVGPNGDGLPESQAQELLRKLPTHTDLAADRVVDVLVKNKVLADDEGRRQAVRNLLLNDPTFKSLTRDRA
jgi:hypothetical protein